MRRIFAMFTLCLVAIVSWAQSQYVSCERTEEQDRIDDAGRSGILVISKRSDLVVTVLNSDKAKSKLLGCDRSNNYLYEIIVDPNECKIPKIEVSKRGDINRSRFTVNLKPSVLQAYSVVEVEKPIALDEQNFYEPILSMDSTAVEFVSSYSDLQCRVSPDLHASVIRTKKQNDDKVYVTLVTIPMASIRIVKDQIKMLSEKCQGYEKLFENYNGKDRQKKLDDWDRCDAELKELDEKWQVMKNIVVYGSNTNRLSVSVENLIPDKKTTYGILSVKPEVVTEAGSLMSEAARLFEMRRYEDAKRTFMNVKNAKDFREDLTPVINANIDDCDSCIVYTMYANGMFRKYVEWKKQGATITQKQLVDCANGALEMFKYLSYRNPCDYYTKGIEKLKQEIDKVPFDLRFTVVKWQNDYSGFQETGPMENVEVWAYYGRPDYAMSHIKKDGELTNKIRKSDDFSLVGTSDSDGIVDLHLKRTELPKGFFFRPVGYQKRAKVKFIDMSNVMAQSQGDYTMRQFRLRMYLEN